MTLQLLRESIVGTLEQVRKNVPALRAKRDAAAAACQRIRHPVLWDDHRTAIESVKTLTQDAVDTAHTRVAELEQLLELIDQTSGEHQ